MKPLLANSKSRESMYKNYVLNQKDDKNELIKEFYCLSNISKSKESNIQTQVISEIRNINLHINIFENCWK